MHEGGGVAHGHGAASAPCTIAKPTFGGCRVEKLLLARALSVRTSQTVPERFSAVVEHAGDDANVTAEEAKVDAVVSSPSTRKAHLLEEHIP
ncbi:MAG: hypothetical protein EOO65_04235 [Methanosarcinales archaeon]|nr:MAG: hypothetical protein EOO65_04235 [Methanosarcinales archaeon]